MGAERWLCFSCGAKSDPMSTPPPGCSRCDAPLPIGKYGLIEELDPERSLRVFRGRESSGPRDVTVRIFPEGLLPTLPGIRQAVNGVASFAHPMIAKPLEAGTLRDRVFVVESSTPGVPVTRADLTLREAVCVMRDVALAIDAAHARGIVHPDLRAENVRVSRAPGTALGGSGWKISLTCFAITGGGSVQADIRSLGAILYTVATGRPPDSGTTPLSPSSLNPMVDTELESIIVMAMEPKASQTPGAGEIAVKLARWLKGEVPSASSSKKASPGPQRFDWSRIRPEARIAAGVSLLLLVLILYLALRRNDPVAVQQAPVLPPQARAPEPLPPPPPPAPAPAAPAVADPPSPPTPSVNPQPPPEPARAPIEPPKPVPPPRAESPAKEVPPAPPVPLPKPSSVVEIGEVQGVHPDLGVFVKLDGTVKPAAGDELEALRNGQVVARLSVQRVTGQERRYPQGCAVCRIVSGAAAQGDQVRRMTR